MTRCPRCGETKDEREFNIDRTRRSGLRCYCRTCHNIANTEYNTTHPVEVSSRKHRTARTLSARFAQAIREAHRRGLGWELTFDEYAALVKDNQCHYCGNPLPEVGCGLDRKENHGKSYSLDNVVPCCTRCNCARGDFFTYEEFVLYIAPAIRACDAAAKVCQLAMTRSFDGYIVTAGIDGYVVTAEGIVRPSLVNDEWR